MGDRRAGDAEMHLAGAGLAHHAHDLHRGGAAHEAVVDEHDALAVDDGAVGRVLQAHAELAHRLRRLDEGAADIVVADDAELVGDAAGLGVADRRRHAGIGHRHDDVGLGRRLAGELGADRLAHLVDVAAVHDRVGAGEIDVLEDAGPHGLTRREADRFDALVRDDDDLAVLDVAHEAGADDVERAGLGGEDVAAVELAEHERADAERIARADQLLVGERDERIGALDLARARR